MMPWHSLPSTLPINIENTKNYNNAFYYAKEAISYSNNAGVRIDRIAAAYGTLATIFEEKNQRDSALYYGRLSLTTLNKKDPRLELYVASFLNDLYAKEGQIDSAYKYLTIASALKDSLFSEEKVKQVQNLEFNKTLRQKQLQQERREAQQVYQTRIKTYGFITGIFVLLLVAFMLYRNNQQKQNANAILQQKNIEIDKQRAKAEIALSELKATQAQLVQSEKMASLGELTAGIAHEIHNPLNFVNNFSEVNTELIEEMKKELQTDNKEEALLLADDIKENEQKINHHGKRADAIVKGMLEHSRASTGKKELTDINALADEHLRLAYHGLRAKDKDFNATIETSFDESIGKIEVIPQDIGRVLLNLFNNAFYAVTEKKKTPTLKGENYEPIVSVSTKRLNDKIEIRVKDNGVGIPQKAVDKIFQPFFTTKPIGQGTGLGLSLSYDIIKAHGGELRMETKEGKGLNL